MQIQKFSESVVPANKGRCFVLLNKLQSEKKQQDEYCAKTMFEFSCQTFCILRSREKVIQARCFVGLET